MLFDAAGRLAPQLALSVFHLIEEMKLQQVRVIHP
jgi:hypothetical protein